MIMLEEDNTPRLVLARFLFYFNAVFYFSSKPVTKHFETGVSFVTRCCLKS